MSIIARPLFRGRSKKWRVNINPSSLIVSSRLFSSPRFHVLYIGISLPIIIILLLVSELTIVIPFDVPEKQRKKLSPNKHGEYCPESDK